MMMMLLLLLLLLQRESERASARREAVRRRSNMAHTNQPRPDFCLGFPLKVLKIFHVVPASLGSSLTACEVGKNNYLAEM